MSRLNDDAIIPLATLKTNGASKPLSQSQAIYYEWNMREQQWTKLIESDPPPPDNLPPGNFDGQIVEVKQPM